MGHILDEPRFRWGSRRGVTDPADDALLNV
jgi:hypothetical protein